MPDSNNSCCVALRIRWRDVSFPTGYIGAIYPRLGLTDFCYPFTVSMLLRKIERPFFGRKMTTIVHFPLRTAFRLVPTNAQYCFPFVMLIRIEPTDRFGMVIDTDATSFTALTFVPGRIVIG